MRNSPRRCSSGSTFEPVRHLVGNLLAGADEAGPLQQRRAMAGQIADGHGVATDMGAQVLYQSPNSGDRSDQLVADGVVEIVLREIVIHQLRQQCQ